MRALAACAAAVFCACPSTSDISVGVPDAIPADSASPITVSATLKFRGVAIADGTDVHFKAAAGSFAADKPTPEVTVRSTGGQAQTPFYPPAAPGGVDLTVSFTNPNREAVATTKKLNVVALPPADAGTLSVGCSDGNIGALVPGAARIEIACTLTMRDSAGNAIASQTAQLYAEAGVVTDKGAQANGTRSFSYVVDPGAAPPADVPSNAAEQASNGDLSNQLVQIMGAREYNPRDGVATILAVVRGHERFDDANGNGAWDDGETFDDEGEPFLDVDDDAVFTASAGDKFFAAFDSNGNGTWDGPNGVYDADTKIGRATHVLWSGAPVLIAEPSSKQMMPSTSSTISIFLHDDNGNPPAGFDSDDKLELSVLSKPSGVSVTGLVTLPLSTDLTMLFDSKTGAFVRLTKDPATQFPVLRRFNVTINDARDPATIMAATNGVNFSIEGKVRYTPAPRTGSVSSREVDLASVGITIK
jgi:hypothetical protein